MLRSATTALIIFSAALSAAAAAPDESTAYLISKPLSLMDWGLVELRRTLDVKLKPIQPPPPGIIADFLTKFRNDISAHKLLIESTWATYDFGTNRLTLQIGVGRQDPKPTESDCSFALKRVRLEILQGYMGHPETDILSRERRREAADEFLSYVFKPPAGYIDRDRPANLVDNLANLIVVRVSTHKIGDDNVFADINCNGSFLGEDVNYEEQYKPFGASIPH